MVSLEKSVISSLVKYSLYISFNPATYPFIAYSCKAFSSTFPTYSEFILSFITFNLLFVASEYIDVIAEPDCKLDPPFFA